ncbi:NUDIX hydrolase [Diaphorobacter sp. HDW4A]|uniref:NUDIX hydrolase n=1 Tax=Diaphorobacter sp. HDW4A TaxID=2714924 RepID=UPI0014078D0D|nr:NUDIX domain-containing protein [Diaphorobacter sp. HDW4A]QIL81632.1 NUDIX hydrolase [Diaphorobacter sp. HDW4A]
MKDRSFPMPIVCTVDVVLLTMKESALQVLLLRREQVPFEGAWALPGGFVHAEEDADTEASAARVLQQKVGIASPYLEQLATFSGLARDPRGWSIAVTYCALVSYDALQKALAANGEGAAQSQLFDVAALPQLPFDHARIVDAAIARVRSKSLYSSLPVFLCGAEFTLPQLQQTYEAVLGEAVNKVSFRRKMEELDMLEAMPGAMRGGAAHRPAQLYRLRPEYRRSLSLLARGL